MNASASPLSDPPSWKALVESSGLRGRSEAMFRGEKIKATEPRVVLQVAFACQAGLPSLWMEKMWCLTFMLFLTAWRAFPSESVVENGKAIPETDSPCRQYRERRVKLRSGHGV